MSCFPEQRCVLERVLGCSSVWDEEEEEEDVVVSFYRGGENAVVPHTFGFTKVAKSHVSVFIA